MHDPPVDRPVTPAADDPDTSARRRASRSIVTGHIAVTRRARYAALGAPGPHLREVWLACHGYGQLAADFLVDLSALEAADRLVVAPEALSRFYLDSDPGPHGPGSSVGATWMTREDRLSEIEDYVEYLQRLRNELLGPDTGASPGLVALGFSQGTATVSRWAARTPTPPDALVLWGGGLPPDVTPAALAARSPGLRVSLVAGARDRWVRAHAIEEAARAIAAAGLEVHVLTFEGGHRLDDETLERLAAAVARPAGQPPSPRSTR